MDLRFFIDVHLVPLKSGSEEAWGFFAVTTPIQRQNCPVCAAIYVLPPPKGKTVCVPVCAVCTTHVVLICILPQKLNKDKTEKEKY